MILATKRKVLTALETRVARLALLRGLSNQEIAEELEMTYSGVACALHRAKKVVRARSSRQGYALLAEMLNGESQG